MVTLSGQNHDEEKMARELVNLLCEVQCSRETTAGIFEWCSHESNQSLVPTRGYNGYLLAYFRIIPSALGILYASVFLV